MAKAPVLIIHGGAGSRKLRGESLMHFQQSLLAIVEKVYPRLRSGASAVEAVTLAAACLEDDPLYNAGRGSKIQSDGKIRMSAALMDGSRRRFAGCVNVEGLRNPIRLARALLNKRDRVLSGPGAKRFAQDLGLTFRSPFTAERRREFLEQRPGKTGTIGALALDRQGHLAAATSTGGRGQEFPFRVSDSATVAGCFANKNCAVSATGVGEEIVESAAAATICAWVEAGIGLNESVERLLSGARRRKAQFGLIALNERGEYTAATTTKNILWAAAGPHGIVCLRE
jgi:L-asparaginase